MLDFDMPCVHSWPVFVDHRSGSFIVDVQQHQTFLQGVAFFKNMAEIFGGLCTSNSGIELSLSREGRDNRLDTTFPCDSCTTQNE